MKKLTVSTLSIVVALFLSVSISAKIEAFQNNKGEIIINRINDAGKVTEKIEFPTGKQLLNLAGGQQNIVTPEEQLLIPDDYGTQHENIEEDLNVCSFEKNPIIPKKDFFGHLSQTSHNIIAANDYYVYAISHEGHLVVFDKYLRYEHARINAGMFHYVAANNKYIYLIYGSNEIMVYDKCLKNLITTQPFEGFYNITANEKYVYASVGYWGGDSFVLMNAENVSDVNHLTIKPKQNYHLQNLAANNEYVYGVNHYGSLFMFKSDEDRFNLQAEIEANSEPFYTVAANDDFVYAMRHQQDQPPKAYSNVVYIYDKDLNYVREVETSNHILTLTANKDNVYAIADFQIIRLYTLEERETPGKKTDRLKPVKINCAN